MRQLLISLLRVPFSAARLYLFFASLMVVISVFFTPEGMTPDEGPHFFRAIQVSQGELTGMRKGNQSGGMIPSSVLPALISTVDLIGHPERHFSITSFDQASHIPWSQTYDFIDFSNVAIYAPGGYLPEALAIRISRLTGLSVLQTFYVARLTNGFVTILLCTAAIALSRRGTAWLLVLASLPMTLNLAGSCSHDGILIGLSALAAAILTRHTAASRWSTGNWLGISALFALLAMAKPPLLLAALLPAAFARRTALRPLLPFTLSLLATAVWYVCGIAPFKVQFLAQTGVSDSGQIRWMLLHPLKTLAVTFHTLALYAPAFACQMIGRLGWLDTPLSKQFYVLTALVLVLAFLSGALWKGAAAARQETRSVLATLAIVAASSLGIMLSLYVIWSPVGSDVISGIQGRYFLPLLPFCALLLPAMPQAGRLAPGLARHQISVALLAVFLSIDAVTLGHALLARFW
ncbi:DUF2142 domain-containing protein [Acetobacter persici]|uniref:DUF2142 domain-containing protein n=1 Tax=Acetobacter persici TaxID=1076596 RepID=UPI0020CC1FD4|nr:DUF2142 domain-containing protein [Acetobacter persici]